MSYCPDHYLAYYKNGTTKIRLYSLTSDVNSSLPHLAVRVENKTLYAPVSTSSSGATSLRIYKDRTYYVLDFAPKITITATTSSTTPTSGTTIFYVRVTKITSNVKLPFSIKFTITTDTAVNYTFPSETLSVSGNPLINNSRTNSNSLTLKAVATINGVSRTLINATGVFSSVNTSFTIPLYI